MLLSTKKRRQAFLVGKNVFLVSFFKNLFQELERLNLSQEGLEQTMQLKMTLNFYYSCLYF